MKNKKDFNKKGQFYIIAAVLIVLAIAGIVSLSTYAVIKSNPKTIKDIGSDLKKEGPRIVDYGIYKKENLTAVVEGFTDKEFASYFLKKTDRANVVFIYGNKTNLYALQYNTTSTGGVTSTIGGGLFQWRNVNTYIDKADIIVNGEKEISVEILNSKYYFNITEGEMFYFVIVQEKEGERYVERN